MNQSKKKLSEASRLKLVAQAKKLMQDIKEHQLISEKDELNYYASVISITCADHSLELKNHHLAVYAAFNLRENTTKEFRKFQIELERKLRRRRYDELDV